MSDDTQGSDSKGGLTNYDHLYADILLWLRKGWIDYVTPQLYREINDRLVPYEKMVTWWAAHSF
ncbi:family 10 glycosylhydrolase, partial [Acinetobacter baumannii]